MSRTDTLPALRVPTLRILELSRIITTNKMKQKEEHRSDRIAIPLAGLDFGRGRGSGAGDGPFMFFIVYQRDFNFFIFQVYPEYPSLFHTPVKSKSTCTDAPRSRACMGIPPSTSHITLR